MVTYVFLLNFVCSFMYVCVVGLNNLCLMQGKRRQKERGSVVASSVV